MNARNRPSHRNTTAEELTLRHRRVALACAAFVAGMAGMSFAAVPFYDWFCRTTGFDGTPRVAATAPSTTIERRIVVRFDSNVAANLPWSFEPEVGEMELKVGETGLVHYVVKNRLPYETSGTASYNVTPALAGYYFNKLQCFCFTEQRLAAGERLELPVAFFVDPEIDQNPDLKSLRTITLSYTFFPGKKAPEPLAASGSAAAPM